MSCGRCVYDFSELDFFPMESINLLIECDYKSKLYICNKCSHTDICIIKFKNNYFLNLCIFHKNYVVFLNKKYSKTTFTKVF